MKRVSGHTIAGVRIQDIGYGHDLHVVELRVYHIGCHFDEAIHRQLDSKIESDSRTQKERWQIFRTSAITWLSTL